jgi:catechol 2,3-dioxygenase-like lactoylglutathione lyase family enzyme
MIPVLAVRDPAAGADFLCARLGFAADAADPLRLSYGDQRLQLAQAGQPLPGLIALPFDHLALRVPDPDRVQAVAQGLGARLHADFTPEGPLEIAEFGPSGVRYVFFQGPEGWPVEFCAPRRNAPDDLGHGHYGLRCADVAAMAQSLQAMGASETSRHRLIPADAPPVEVMFLQLGSAVFELFDAPPLAASLPAAGWIGFLP